MPTPLRRRLRLVRRGIGYAVAIALVLVALVLGVASQVLPLAERHPERVAAWLSERADRPIAFDAVQTEWTRRGPLLQLRNLRVGAGERAFVIGDTEMLVSIYAGLLPGVPLSELRLRGLDLTLERSADGRWQVRGLPGQQQAGGDPFAALEGLGELQVIDGQLRVHSPQLGVDAIIPSIDLRLQVTGDEVRAGLRAWPQGVEGPSLDAVAELDRASGDGRAYAGARELDLAPWSSLLQLMGIAVATGEGRAQAWIGLAGNRISRITVDAQLRDVVLQATSPAAPTTPRVAFASVATRARWQRIDGGWRLDAPLLRAERGGREHVFDGLLLAAGKQRVARAERIDLEPVAAVAALSDRLLPSVRRWLAEAQPAGSITDLALDGGGDGVLHARAGLQALSFQPVGDRPGLAGLTGTLEGDADGFSFVIDPSRSVRFDWPSGFGVTHAVDLRGTVAGWREGGGWRIGTGALRVRGEDFGARARGDLWWQGDGTRPRMELALALDDTDLTAAKGFWVRHAMPPALVAWLDGALVAGTVRDGRALVSGDLDDWPFGGGEGRFEASARITGATVRYQPDWLPAQDLELEARFIGDSMDVRGAGAVGAVPVRAVHAAIDHYRGGTLTVEAEGGGDLAGLLDLVRASPLRALHPETFDNVAGSGGADADFRMRLPLGQAGRLTLDGGADLAGARLAAPVYGLAFNAVTGRVGYDQRGFTAEDLEVRHEGRPGRLSLRAGVGHVRAAGNLFEGEVAAMFNAGTLLDRAPELGWLKPHVDGQSSWSVGVEVPASAPGAPAATRLRLRSDLVGTALRLPAPLAKPAATALQATVETPLPVGSGEVRVSLGQRLGLRARSSAGRTGIRVVLGRSDVAQAPPAAGLVVGGRVAVLDAMEWIALAAGAGAGGSGNGVGLGRIDVSATRLRLFAGEFADTRLLVLPGSGGSMRVRAEGASLQGELRVPAGKGATVAGRFDRVHWRRPAAAGAATRSASTARAAPAAESVDPASIPPLSLDIEDLRIAGAGLGRATLRTRPTPDGLLLEQLQTRAPGQQIDVGGRWSGRGENAQTELEAAIASDDIGALLAQSEARDRLAGGEGNLRLEAAWPGSPADFAPAALQGSLTLDVRDGRLLKVEPGAGRVLGLLSVAELPRRLSLDFRDFFSRGFAFNRAGGTISFSDGLARAEDLRIEGPAADIAIRGSADLRRETYDQTIDVHPSTGNLLTVAGALAGGPVGAALGAAANAVLQKPMAEIGARTYRVTGPWEDPRVEVVAREPAPAAPPAQPPSG